MRGDRHESMVRFFDGLALGLDLVAHRVAGVHLGDASDGAVERGREEHRLAGLAGAAARCGRPVAGTPCRACGRPRRARRCARRRAAPSCAGRGRRVARAWRSRCARRRHPWTARSPWCRRTRPCTRRPFALAMAANSSRTWVASSRVGTSTSASGCLAASGSSCSTIGIANPSVLPDPVFDFASVSRPDVASSITIDLDRERLVDAHAGEGLDDGVGHAEVAEGRDGFAHLPCRLAVRLEVEGAVERADEVGHDEQLRQRQRFAASLGHARGCARCRCGRAAAGRRGATRTTATRSISAPRSGGQSPSMSSTLTGPLPPVPVVQRIGSPPSPCSDPISSRRPGYGSVGRTVRRAERCSSSGAPGRRWNDTTIVGERSLGTDVRSRRRARAGRSPRRPRCAEYPRSNTSRSSFHRRRSDLVRLEEDGDVDRIAGRPIGERQQPLHDHDLTGLDRLVVAERARVVVVGRLGHRPSRRERPEVLAEQIHAVRRRDRGGSRRAWRVRHRSNRW